MQYWHFST